MQVTRTPDQVESLFFASQAASFKASDSGDTDDYAEAIYATLQWLTGNSDVNPMDEYDEVE